MPLIQAQSLAGTVDAVNEAFFFQRAIPAAEARGAGAFIASRLGLEGAYAGTFALWPAERTAGIRLFTGQRAVAASARHIAAQEACRALRLLQVRGAAGKALQAASARLLERVGPAAPRDPRPEDGQQHWNWDFRGGTYCCGPCTVAYWRHLTAGGYDQQDLRLSRGLLCLRTMRKDDHTWHKFPFWYTLSALVEMPVMRHAREEMKWVARHCQTLLRREGADPIIRRRNEIIRRLLARV